MYILSVLRNLVSYYICIALLGLVLGEYPCHLNMEALVMLMVSNKCSQV